MSNRFFDLLQLLKDNNIIHIENDDLLPFLKFIDKKDFRDKICISYNQNRFGFTEIKKI